MEEQVLLCQSSAVLVVVEKSYQKEHNFLFKSLSSFVKAWLGRYRLGAMYNTVDDLKNQKDIATSATEDHTYGAWLAVEQ